MRTWPIRHAREKFSAMFSACLVDGPQLITRGGIETAVLVRADAWHRLQVNARPSLKQLLLAEGARWNPAERPRFKANRRTAAAAR